MSVHAECAKYLYQTWVFFEVQGIYWFLLLFEMYLLASTHFINFSFFILLGFFVVYVN